MDTLKVPNRDGLRSITTRLSKLEENNKQETHNNLIARLQKIEAARKNTELDKLNASYITALTLKIADVSPDNIVDIIIFTISYVKRNLPSIGKLVGARGTQEFERLVSVCFIESVVEGYSTEMITRSVSVIDELLEKKKNEEEEFETPNPNLQVALTRKKSFKLFRKK